MTDMTEKFTRAQEELNLGIQAGYTPVRRLGERVFKNFKRGDTLVWLSGNRWIVGTAPKDGELIVSGRHKTLADALGSDCKPTEDGLLIERFNESNNATVIKLFWGKMRLVGIGEDDANLVSEELTEGSPNKVLEEHEGWWWYWDMPGFTDMGSFMGPFDLRAEAESDAVEVMSLWDMEDLKQVDLDA